MAARDSLKTFQNRLNDRLQAAQLGGVSASWLGVDAGGQRVLLPLSHAGEIFPWSGARRVPYAQPWFVGVASLRGVLNGVIDLGLFLGQGSVSAGRAMPQARLIALNPVLDVNAALLVDGLLGLKTVDAFAAAVAPDGQVPAYFGHRYEDTQGQHWQELNLQSLAQDAGFLGVGAGSAATEHRP